MAEHCSTGGTYSTSTTSTNFHSLANRRISSVSYLVVGRRRASSVTLQACRLRLPVRLTILQESALFLRTLLEAAHYCFVIQMKTHHTRSISGSMQLVSHHKTRPVFRTSPVMHLEGQLMDLPQRESTSPWRRSSVLARM